jgi:hypothetical protein
MIISEKAWKEYINTLAKIQTAAYNDLKDFLARNGGFDIYKTNPNLVIDYVYGLSTKYGEAASALACELYDAVALAEGVSVPSAVPAATATISETAKLVNGTANISEVVFLQAAPRLVKQASEDTILQNAERDGSYFAWIPSGDSCSFCITLASRGWQRISKKALKNGHAEHIHANCDCHYAIKFNSDSDVAGYDPDKYYQEYADADSDINEMRRISYQENKDEINAQRRERYAEKKESSES